MHMKVVASIQVRMGSSRFPGKVMKRVSGVPLLGHLVRRLSFCNTLNEIVVATSTNPENDVIEGYCRQESIPCFRGAENDVLDRTLGALRSRGADIGVEVFGDCPLIDPCIVDQTITYFLESGEYDYVGNDLKTTYPPGMEVEVFRVSSLEDSSRRLSADDPIREHGTLYIRQNSGIYNIFNLEAPRELARPDLELEIDTQEDFSVIKIIIEHFDGVYDFPLQEIISFLDKRPQIAAINSKVHRRWKEYRND